MCLVKRYISDAIVAIVCEHLDPERRKSVRFVEGLNVDKTYVEGEKSRVVSYPSCGTRGTRGWQPPSW